MTGQKRIAYGYIAIMAFCVFIQFIIGADIVLLIFMAAASLMGVFAIRSNRIFSSNILLFAICLYTGSLAILAKTLLLQPIDQNLYNPQATSLVVLIFTLVIFVSYSFSALIRDSVKFQPLLEGRFDDPGFIRFVAFWGYSAGFIIHIIHFAIRPQYVTGLDEVTDGFGGLGELYSLMLIGFSAQIYYAVRTRRRKAKFVAIAMFFGFVLASFSGNVKRDIIDAILIVSICVLVFRIKISIPLAIGGVFVAISLIFVINPLIHITREQTDKQIGARLVAAIDILVENNFNLIKINEINSRVAQSFDRNYRESGSYVYPSTANVDRFSLVLPIDQVTRVEDPGRVSYSVAARRAAELILPSAIVEKSAGIVADLVAWAYGFRTPGIIGRPVVGLAASSYAINGYIGVIVIGFVCTFILFVTMDLLLGRLDRSILAISMSPYTALVAERGPDAIFAFLLRTLPVSLALLMVLWGLYRFLGRRASVGHSSNNGRVGGRAMPRKRPMPYSGLST